MNDENSKQDIRKHFKLARRIIASWPKWKQAIGFAPMRNTNVASSTHSVCGFCENPCPRDTDKLCMKCLAEDGNK